MPCPFIHFLIVAVSVLAPEQQMADRRSRELPEVVPRAGDGRHGTCDVLRFTPAGDMLFAAGDDKVITGWRHAVGGLDPAPAKTDVLRWPAWREQRGGVKSFDVSADGKRVLVGGFGLRTSSVALLDRDHLDGRTKQLITWPDELTGGVNVGTVPTVAFAADGESVAFGTSDGSVWLWQPRERVVPDRAGRRCNLPLWVGGKAPRTVRRPDGALEKFSDPPVTLFFRKDTLVTVRSEGSVVEYDIANPTTFGTVRYQNPAPAKSLFDVHIGDNRVGVFRAVYDRPRDRLVVACDATNRVLVRELNQEQSSVLELPSEHFARSVAVHPKTGTVAVAVASVVPAKDDHPQFHNDADDMLYLYDNPAKKQKPDQELPFRGQAEALAFHPTLNRLAVAGGDASEVTLLDLAAPEKPLTVVRGSGRRVWELALAADGSALGMRTKRDPAADLPNGRGAGDWSWMDLTKLIPSPNAPKRWVAAVTTADGWRVEPDNANRDLWYAVHPDEARVRLDIEAKLFNKPTCFTFLKKTDTAPTRLIVGHYYGASLFELPAVNSKAKLLAPKRVYIGHSGEVLSVAAVDDAKGGWFVTGGADHTLAAYHLGGWKSLPDLGASFGEVGTPARPVVTAVDVGSPGWEAGLQVGDEVELLAVGNQRVFDCRPAAKGTPVRNGPDIPDERGAAEAARETAADLAAARAALGEAVPLRQLYFHVRTKGGATRDVHTSVKHRPLWKLYPTFTPDDKPAEWVTWMWNGSYYQTASPNGDELVGWHLNGPTPNQAPRFHPLSNYKGYQRNEVVRTLVRDRDLAAALDRIGRQEPPVGVGLAEPAPIRLAVDRLEVTDKPVTVRVTVERRGSDVDKLTNRVELWVNDYRYKAWVHDPAKPFDDTVRLDPAVFRSEDKRKVPYGDNVLTVQRYNQAGDRLETATRVLTNRNAPAPPNLLGLAVGVNDYQQHRVVSGARGVVGDLKYAVADASLVTDSFTAHVGAKRHFPAGQLGLEKDAAVVRKKLLADLAALKKVAKPNDMLVLFLAGHGQLIGRKKDEKAVTEVIADAVVDPEKTYTDIRFAFCCPNFATGKPGDAIITADELYEELAGINCRKMVLLDVCRSGWAAKTDVIRKFVPNGLGPFVLAACGPGQKSYENDDLKHGLFTAALTEAITVGAKKNAAFPVADTDRDGTLSCQELFDYIRKRVTEERDDQTPTCFPDRARLPRTVVVSARR